MTLWEFAACVDGWNISQSGEPAIEAPTAEEYYDLVERLG
jgi:hypothetical protein